MGDLKYIGLENSGTVSTLIGPYRTSTPFPFASLYGKGLRFPHALSAETGFIGHKYFSALKYRDPDSRRRAPSLASSRKSDASPAARLGASHTNGP